MDYKLLRVRWAAVGAAVAVVLGAGGFGFVRATEPAGASAYTPITPCRLFDTRAGVDNVGARSTPLGTAEEFTTQITGVNGNCSVPAAATAIVVNLTGVNATATTFVAAFPAGTVRPTAANLNLRAGSSPTPNLATVRLSGDGKITFYNHAGTINLIADVNGYYTDHGHDDRYYTKAQTDALVDAVAVSDSCQSQGATGVVIGGYATFAGRFVSHCLTGRTTTIAGNGTFGFVDGTAGPAGTTRFTNPNGVAVAADGSIIVADTNNHRVRRIDTAGNTTTIAGDGTAGFFDGTGGPAGTTRFNFPSGVAVAADGSIIVADSSNHRVRRIDTAGNTTTIAGNGTGGFVDGTGGPAGTTRFAAPAGVAVAADGSIIVADTSNHRVRRIDTAGNTTTIAGNGTGGFVDGTGGPAGTTRFNFPSGVAVAADGSIIVADANNHRVRRIDTAGNTTTIAGGFGFVDGTGGPAGTTRFTSPVGVAVAPDGSIIVADTTNHRVRRIN